MIFNAGGNGVNIPNKETLLRMTQVWKNENPSQPFTNQTVELSAVKGTILYFVEYLLYYGNNGSYKSDLAVPNHHTVLGSNYYDHDKEKFVEVTRNVTITDTSASFSDDSVDGEYGEYVVPVSIYALHT